ncbi:MAG: hypothetical protein J6B06_05935 [Lachnospiraceae bacterium]|nr:hypothetical protein [Lachnospiraceae bacterium]
MQDVPARPAYGTAWLTRMGKPGNSLEAYADGDCGRKIVPNKKPKKNLKKY